LAGNILRTPAEPRPPGREDPREAHVEEQDNCQRAFEESKHEIVILEDSHALAVNFAHATTFPKRVLVYSAKGVKVLKNNCCL